MSVVLPTLAISPHAVRRLLESTEDGYVELDASFRYLFMNSVAARINGWQLSEVPIGRTVEDLFPGWDESEVGRKYWRAFEAQEETHFEIYYEPFARFYEISLFPHPLGLLARYRDITERKQAADERQALVDALRAERSRLEASLEVVPALVIFFAGPGHVVLFVNEEARRLLPHAASSIGQPLDAALPEMATDEIVGLLDQVYATDTPSVIRERALILPASEGSQRFFDFSCQPIRDRTGKVEGVATFAFEVTGSVEARRAIERTALREQAARSAAEDASRAKDDFLSTLSHELRTPLNAVIGWSQLLRTGDLEPARVSRALETIERNARAQARLIEDMLDLGRIVQGKMVLSVGPLEMVRVVESALEAVRLAAEAKSIRLQPVLDSHATIVGDADRLQQVLWNLLSNAIKFTPRGGRVQVRLRLDASYVEVVVADSGQGIDPTFLPHVFDRFRQADSGAARHIGGLGLGLAIARSVVELHGGLITAESDGIGTGATFTVRLPIAPLRAETPPPPGDSERAGAPTFECPVAVRGLRVLVVDDEPDTRTLIKYLLQQCEARVTVAASAAEALAVLKTQPVDVLVSDIGMPECDGFSFIKQVRELPPPMGRTPALALTAYARSEDRTAVLRAGFQMHLAKPIEPNELLVVIATLAMRTLPEGTR